MNDNNNSIKTLLLGMFVGASFVTLMNKDSREKIKKSLMASLEKGDQKLSEFGEMAKDKMDSVKNDIKNVRRKV